MISHLLSKLSAPRAADWRFNVSVAVAVICNQRKGIVCVSDQKATFSDFSADFAATKAKRIYRNWFVLYAGDDVEFVPRIIRQATAVLGDDDDGTVKTVEQVVNAVEDAYWDAFHAQIESKVLRRYKFTCESFQENGKKKLTDTVYTNICARIDKVKLSLQFLVYGFDSNGMAHIYAVTGEDSPKCYDQVGIWSIGSGSHAALSSLAFHIDNRQLNIYRATPEQALYFACEAKFMAESSGQVGREAALGTIHTAYEGPFNGVDSDIYCQVVTPAKISKIKEIWKTGGQPRVPDGIENQITEILTPKQMVLASVPQTSESEP
jgi:20S proteasome alpha/beta subunit